MAQARYTAAPGRRRRVRRRRSRRPVDSVRSVRPGEEEGRAACVRGSRLQRVGGGRIDARCVARAVAAVVTGSGRHRHCAGCQRPQPTRIRGGLTRHTSGGRARCPRGVDLHRRIRAGVHGVLDGLRATTHWLAAADLARRYPSIDLDANVLYVDNGRASTSAGAAAGFDLCIHMVRHDLGADVAASVARLAVMPLERAGGQRNSSNTRLHPKRPAPSRRCSHGWKRTSRASFRCQSSRGGRR